MSWVFSTRRKHPARGHQDIAARLAEPRSVADVLPARSFDDMRAFAASENAARDTLALSDALQRHSLAKRRAGQIGTHVVDPVKTPPDPRLIAKFGPDSCLKHRVIPWRATSGRVTVIAASRERFLRVRDALTALFGPIYLAIVPSDVLDSTLSRMCHKTLMENAELRTATHESCRDWDSGKAGRWGAAAIISLLVCFLGFY